MGGQHAERLQECLQSDLPVTPHVLDHVYGLEAIAQPRTSHGHVANDVTELLLKRSGVRVEVDEDETLPRGDLVFGEIEVRLVHVLEVPRAGKILQRAVEVPAEPVIGTAQLGHITVDITQLPAPVET